MYRGTSIGGFLLAAFALTLAAGLVIYATLVALVFIALVALGWAAVWVARELTPGPRALSDEEVEELLGYAPPHRYVEVPRR